MHAIFIDMRRLPRRKHLINMILTLSILIIVIIIKSPSLQQTAITAQPGLWLVTDVDDGDTIKVRDPLGHEETVRFIGVDTPEVKDPRKPVQCFGEAASAHTKSVIKIGSSVRLAPDPQDSDRDKYNRLLRYVYLPDGTLYNLQLIRDGYGFAYVVFPYSKLAEFKATETEAKSVNRGLWASCGVDTSSIIKQTTWR
jgi:endonuclease YncB( thermonuclease family)